MKRQLHTTNALRTLLLAAGLALFLIIVYGLFSSTATAPIEAQNAATATPTRTATLNGSLVPDPSLTNFQPGSWHKFTLQARYWSVGKMWIDVNPDGSRNLALKSSGPIKYLLWSTKPAGRARIFGASSLPGGLRSGHRNHRDTSPDRFLLQPCTQI